VPIIPLTQKLEIRRITIRGKPGQKVRETPSPQPSQVWGSKTPIPTTQKAINWKILLSPQEKSTRTYMKNNLR
jgi:hypothetical protein